MTYCTCSNGGPKGPFFSCMKTFEETTKPTPAWSIAVIKTVRPFSKLVNFQHLPQLGPGEKPISKAPPIRGKEGKL